MAEGLEPGDVVTVDFEYDLDDSAPDNNLLTKKPAYFHQIGTTKSGALSCIGSVVPGGVSPVKIFAALGRFVHRPEPPTPPAKPFDDGLVEIARLIAREEPARDGAEAGALANSQVGGPR